MNTNPDELKIIETHSKKVEYRTAGLRVIVNYKDGVPESIYLYHPGVASNSIVVFPDSFDHLFEGVAWAQEKLKAGKAREDDNVGN